MAPSPKKVQFEEDQHEEEDQQFEEVEEDESSTYDDSRSKKKKPRIIRKLGKDEVVLEILKVCWQISHKAAVAKVKTWDQK